MKKLLVINVLCVCLLMGQDQPQIPGWGVYIGYGLMGATGDNFDSDLMTTSNALGFGISKGVWLGKLPLQVGIGVHPRGYKKDNGDETSKILNLNFLDLWAQMPYPIGPMFLGFGLNIGSFINGQSKTEFDNEIGTFNLNVKTKLKSDAYGLDYGFNFGISYPIGKTQVGVLYMQGLTEHENGEKFNGLFFNAGYSL